MSLSTPILVPLPTPFTDDTVTISEVRVARLVRFFKEAGAAGFVLCSEVGDHLCLSHSERKELLEHVNREAGGLPIIVNVTAFTTAAMIDLCQHAERHGARATVYKPPVSLQLTNEELGNLALAFRRHCNLPTGLIAPPDQVAAVLGENVGHNWAHMISVPGAYSISHQPMTCEFECRDGVCSPLAMFGPARARHIFGRAAETQPVAEGIFKLGGPMRFARAAASLLPFDLAVGRSPVQGMHGPGLDVMKKLFESGA